jgi:RNA polymerase sigma-70 factor (ECF subfamily)
MDRNEEKKLIISAQKGSVEAFEQLYSEFKMELYRSALLHIRSPQDAEDAVSETFIKAFRSIGRFDTKYPMRPWLHQILVNECNNIYKKRKTGDVTMDDFSTDWRENVVDRETDTEEKVIESIEDEEVKAMIAQLGEEHKKVLVLHYFNNLDLVTIADSLGVPVGTVKSRLFHARKQLSKLVEQEMAR